MMQTNVQTVNPNFQGAFVINYKRAIPGLKEGFEKVVNSGKNAIYRDFQGDARSVLYVLRDNHDADIAHFIKKNEMKFVYYPNINLRSAISRSGRQKPVKSINFDGQTSINKTKDLLEFVSENQTRQMGPKPQKKFDAEQFLKDLNIEVKGKAKKNRKGVIVVKDPNNEAEVVISPESKYGNRYVYVKPASKQSAKRRFVVNKDNKIERPFNGPNGIVQFWRAFETTLKK